MPVLHQAQDLGERAAYKAQEKRNLKHIQEIEARTTPRACADQIRETTSPHFGDARHEKVRLTEA